MRPAGDPSPCSAMLCVPVHAASDLATVSRREHPAGQHQRHCTRLQCPLLPGQQVTPSHQSRQGDAGDALQTYIPVLCLQARTPHDACSTEHSSRCRQRPLASQHHNPQVVATDPAPACRRTRRPKPAAHSAAAGADTGLGLEAALMPSPPTRGPVRTASRDQITARPRSLEFQGSEARSMQNGRGSG